MSTLITLGTTIVGAAIGYYIKYFLDKKKERNTEVTKERGQMYQKFIDWSLPNEIDVLPFVKEVLRMRSKSYK